MAHRSFKLPDELDARLVDRAAAEQRSLGWCIKQALEEWLGSEGGSTAQPAGGRDRAGSIPVPATPRAPAKKSPLAPAFARATQLGTPAKPIPRRGR